MPTYTNGKTTIHTTYGICYLFIPLMMLYEYLYGNYEKNNTIKHISQEEKNIVELLNYIEEQEIRDELRQLLLDEQEYLIKCDIIRKYNNPEYSSNQFIKKIISFAILKNETIIKPTP